MAESTSRPVKLIVVALLSFSCWGTQRVNAQDIQLTVNGVMTMYVNNSIVTRTDIGTGSAALLCTTTNEGCCSRDNSDTTHWYFPDGGQVTNNRTMPYYRTRSANVPRSVQLHRNSDGTTTGIFRCTIPDASGVTRSMFVGIYDSGAGQVTISGGINFQLNSVLDANTPVFTLTCTSTGGPATTVSWTRGGDTLTDDNNHGIASRVSDTVTATYVNTLTVSGRLEGPYTCSVSNSRTSPAVALPVAAAGEPSSLGAVPAGPTSFTVSWTAPTSGATVTGYRIYWSGGSQSGMGANVGDTAVTVSGRSHGMVYTISIVALSDQLPSPVVRLTVTFAPSAPTITMANVMSPTSVVLSWTQLSGEVVNNYEIVFSYQGPCGGFTHTDNITVVGSSRTHTLSGLEEFSSYTISVTAVNAGGRATQTRMVTTLSSAPSGAPQMITAVTAGRTTISVRWERVNCTQRNSEITGYVVSYGQRGDESDSETETVMGTTNLMYTVMGLNASTEYFVMVAAMNSGGDPGPFSNPVFVETTNTDPPPTTPTTPTTTTTMTTTPGNGTDSPSVGGDGGAIAGGIIGALLVVVLIVVIVIVAVWLWRRYSQQTKYSTKTSRPARPPPPVHFKKAPQNGEGVKTVEPIIQQFPKDTHVTEGEAVSFKVKVSGHPKPALQWYHESKEVVADYSLEVGEEGNLTIASAEPRHTGVYQLVAQNSTGSVEKEVKLFVHVEGEAAPHVQRRVVELKPVPVADFGKFVVQNHASNNRGFRDQYGTIEAEEEFPATIGTTSKTRPLNRFANITVYDHNRVILTPLAGYDDCQRDYINACYVDGYSIPKKFIATQGPLPKTVVDFWRLVWQEKPPTIVMVTNIKELNKIKCQQYWPETGSKNCGPFQVTITDQQIFADYTIRTFQVNLSGGSNRPLRVTQYHFTAWPDHGVPDYATPILAFHRRVKSHHKPSRGPLLVHCSAGVGRTGTYITIDCVLEQVEKEQVVDIARTVSKIRKQRMKMVQTVEQYIFVHDAVLESLTCGDTQILPANIRTAIAKLERRDRQTNITGYESQFKVLHQVSPKPEEVRTETAIKYPEKNRNLDFLPADRWRVLLKGEHPDYIHAVSVNGYKQQKAFIITQGPLQSTCRDFWKMVYDRNCGAIVMLSQLNENGKDVCYQYWPTSGIKEVGEYTVDLLGEEELEGFVLRTLSVMEAKSGKAHQVMQFHIVNWGPDGRCSNLKTVTDVIEEVSKVQRRTGNNPIVVHCSDTVSRSGMYCAMATTIERCKTEGVVDVFQVVKALRVQKPGGVLTVEQYQVVFKAVLVFLDSFDTYANFQNI